MTEKEIQKFWEVNLCGNWFIKSKYPSADFFQEYIDFRYNKEHHIKKIVDFKSSKGKTVLDIGLGVGADALNWAKHAKSYTGVDLTKAAVESTKTLFKLNNLNCENIFQGDVISGFENIIPSTNKFNIIYSHGVLHHSSNLNTALSNIKKYLKKDGKLIIMLYNKDSFNYWFRIQFYFRIKFLFSLLKKKLGLKNDKIWSQHVNNYLKLGPKYFSWSNWPHRCTDGPNCSVANIYSKKEMQAILLKNKFKIIKMTTAHFSFSNGKMKRIETFFAKYLGFYQFIESKHL